MIRRNWHNVAIAMGLASSLGLAFIVGAWVLDMFETKTGVLIYGIVSGVGQFVLGDLDRHALPHEGKMI